jgi:hypothetical protein
MADNSSNVANIWAVMGASGTGKGLWIKSQLKSIAPQRLIVWDFKDEYREFAKHSTSSTAALLAAVKKAGEGGGQFRFITQAVGEKGMKKDFETVCNIVYAWENAMFIAEELSNVTTASYAPAAWRKMTTSGRHANIHIIGASQTPATIDKSFLGNATLIHVSGLRQENHRKAVATSMDIDIDRITKLMPLEYIEKDFHTGQVLEGQVQIPRKKTTKVTQAVDVATKPPKKAAPSTTQASATATPTRTVKPSTRFGFFG